MLRLFAFILGTMPAIAAPLPPLQTEDGLDAAFARAAVRDGRILPLEQILDILRDTAEGEIIEIQLELEEGLLVYEFDLIGPDGHVFEVEIDAATGRVLEIEYGAGDED
ncbi:PepSY domain-containing protein [Paracoccus sp. NSM]|uniref:PepSY domain-containing protein n=1 Tax=Paracoccus sp. NSM TaxID=3457784 RepID=UPI00403722AF